MLQTNKSEDKPKLKKPLNSTENLEIKTEQKCLPSFLFENKEEDDYFYDKNSDDSEDEREYERKKTSSDTKNAVKNMFNKSFILDSGNNIFDDNINRNYTYSSQNLNVIRSNNNSMGSDDKIQYKVNLSNGSSNNSANQINNHNNINDNFSKSYTANSFNQPMINSLYQNNFSNHSINNSFMGLTNININIPILNNNINNQINTLKSYHNASSTSYNNIPQYYVNNKSFSFNQNSCNINVNLKTSNIIPKKFPKEDEKMLNRFTDSNISVKKLFNMPDYSLYTYILTQKGSREMQFALKKLKEKDVDMLLDKLKDRLSEVTNNKYGNYFIRKLIQVCLPSHRIKILKYCGHKFVDICNHEYGTHPFQSLIEMINMPEEKKLVLSYILNNELTLSLHSNGTYIVQKFISVTKDDERKELNENLSNIIDKLIIDPFGVCVIIKLVKHTKDKEIHKKIADYITLNGALNFIQHPYANYAVQNLITCTDLSYCDSIIETIVDNYLSLSMQKFSSNLVENCIKFCDKKSIKKIYDSVVEDNKLESLLNNSYGNFVLEKLIMRLSKDEKLALIKKIDKIGKTKELSNVIKNLLYG